MYFPTGQAKGVIMIIVFQQKVMENSKCYNLLLNIYTLVIELVWGQDGWIMAGSHEQARLLHISRLDSQSQCRI